MPDATEFQLRLASSSHDSRSFSNKLYTVTGMCNENMCADTEGERATAAAADELREITSEFWSWRLRQVPEFASSLGVHDYDDRLETFTLEAFRHRKVD